MERESEGLHPDPVENISTDPSGSNVNSGQVDLGALLRGTDVPRHTGQPLQGSLASRTVYLVCFRGAYLNNFDLPTYCKLLNKNNSVITFRYIDQSGPTRGDPIGLKPNLDVLPPETRGEKRRDYPLEAFFSTLETVKAAVNISDPVIGITDLYLEENSFNRHDPQSGVGIVTLHRHRDHSPPGYRLYDYLAYLTFCSALSLLAGMELEHDEPNGCLNDVCDNSESLKGCLEQPHICHQICHRRLQELGLTSTEVSNLEARLHGLNRISPLARLNDAFRRHTVIMVCFTVSMAPLMSHFATSAHINDHLELAFIIVASVAAAFLLWDAFKTNIKHAIRRHDRS